MASSTVPTASLVLLTLATLSLGTRAPRPRRIAPPPIAARAERRETPHVLDPTTASAQELESLPGVGPAVARRIVERRATHGPYRSLADLDEVKGIGPALLGRLAPYVRFQNRSNNQPIRRASESATTAEPDG